MNDFGFISGKLEIKFLILYIASRVVGPAPFEVLQEIGRASCRERVSLAV